MKICDVQAGAILKCINGHNGHNSCKQCKAKVPDY